MTVLKPKTNYCKIVTYYVRPTKDIFLKLLTLLFSALLLFCMVYNYTVEPTEARYIVCGFRDDTYTFKLRFMTWCPKSNFSLSEVVVSSLSSCWLMWQSPLVNWWQRGLHFSSLFSKSSSDMPVCHGYFLRGAGMKQGLGGWEMPTTKAWWFSQPTGFRAESFLAPVTLLGK